MSNQFITKIENGVLILVRDIKDTVPALTIINKLSESYLDTMDEGTLNPLVEYANDLQEQIDNGQVCFTLVGQNNFITFTDNNFPLLEGGVYLKDVNINNPYLKNVKLVNVDIRRAESTTIHFTKIDGLLYEDPALVHLLSCYVDSDNQLVGKWGRAFRFFLNQFMPEAV